MEAAPALLLQVARFCVSLATMVAITSASPHSREAQDSGPKIPRDAKGVTASRPRRECAATGVGRRRLYLSADCHNVERLETPIAWRRPSSVLASLEQPEH
jgi:hypothetical protein